MYVFHEPQQAQESSSSSSSAIRSRFALAPVGLRRGAASFAPTPGNAQKLRVIESIHRYRSETPIIDIFVSVGRRCVRTRARGA